jgi:hypothetical protein
LREGLYVTAIELFVVQRYEVTIMEQIAGVPTWRGRRCSTTTLSPPAPRNRFSCAE